MTVRLIQGDCREKFVELAAESIDAIVTDPPYGLGFMGKDWDRGVPGESFWRPLLRVAKPGAHLLAFGGSRVFHRLWCAIEDSGWEIRDTVLWLHGEGFPKSKNQRREWEGWGTQLKPAFEPIVLARKNFSGTVEDNLAKFRVGALNIGDCRVESGERPLIGSHSARPPDGFASSFDMGSGFRIGTTEVGRWPANVLHDGSDEVVAAFPVEAGAFAPVRRRGADKFRNSFGAFKGDIDEAGSTFHGDSGSAARFFWCPKASRQDRNEGLELENFHPTVKPTELMQYLVRLVTPKGGTVLDPFMGSGSTGKACEREGMSFIGIDLDPAYLEIAKRRILGVAPLFANLI